MAIKIKEHETIEELKKEIRQSTDDGRYQLRLRTILMAREGYSYKTVLEKMLISKNTYYDWLHRYNKGGCEALKNIKIPGRKEGNPKYDTKIFTDIFKTLDKMDEYWSTPKIQKLIETKHGIKVPLETIRSRLKKAGYSYKSNRPSPYKGDKELQEEFKKTR